MCVGGGGGRSVCKMRIDHAAYQVHIHTHTAVAAVLGGHEFW